MASSPSPDATMAACTPNYVFHVFDGHAPRLPLGSNSDDCMSGLGGLAIVSQVAEAVASKRSIHSMFFGPETTVKHFNEAAGPASYFAPEDTPLMRDYLSSQEDGDSTVFDALLFGLASGVISQKATAEDVFGVSPFPGDVSLLDITRSAINDPQRKNLSDFIDPKDLTVREKIGDIYGKPMDPNAIFVSERIKGGANPFSNGEFDVCYQPMTGQVAAAAPAQADIDLNDASEVEQEEESDLVMEEEQEPKHTHSFGAKVPVGSLAWQRAQWRREVTEWIRKQYLPDVTELPFCGPARCIPIPGFPINLLVNVPVPKDDETFNALREDLHCSPTLDDPDGSDICVPLVFPGELVRLEFEMLYYQVMTGRKSRATKAEIIHKLCFWAASVFYGSFDPIDDWHPTDDGLHMMEKYRPTTGNVKKAWVGSNAYKTSPFVAEYELLTTTEDDSFVPEPVVKSSKKRGRPPAAAAASKEDGGVDDATRKSIQLVVANDAKNQAKRNGFQALINL